MDVIELFQLNENEVFSQLGSYLPKTRSLVDNETKGRNWFEANKKKLAELICPKYENLKNKDEIEAILEIAATIADFFLGVPANIVAVIIVKIGLNTLCK